MQTPRILVVDDESSLRTALFRVLNRKGYQVITGNCLAEAQVLSQSSQKIDLALIDLKLPDGNGLDLLGFIKNLHPDCQIIILTGYGSVEDAVRATKEGAFHFLTKPFNLEELMSLVDKALDQKSLRAENTALRTALHSKYKFENIVGQSESIRKVLGFVERVADSDSTVLVSGESGTGKELIAKAIHYNSPRSTKPFVPINCGAIPGELLESELFGHVKGAFTGAIHARVGRFEMAQKGTIFLDEIGDMPVSLQVKLLRVLQERKFEPVGSTKTMECDVRIIAATNVDLEKAVAEGKFREDLYYRLNVIPMTIPPLRERQSDLPLLIQHFIDTFNKNKNRQISGISAEALDLLHHYNWPGNIRELENLVERIAILKGTGQIDIYDLPEKYRQRNYTGAVNSSFTHAGVENQHSSSTTEVSSIPENGMDFNSAVDAYENALILQALEKTGWNRNQAAILLKLNRTTLVEKIKKKGLKPPEASA